MPRRNVDGFVTPRRNPSNITGKLRAVAAPAYGTIEPAEKETTKTGPKATPPTNNTPSLQFDLPRYKPHQRPATVVRKRRRWTRIIAKTSAVLGVAVLLVGGYIFWRGYVNMHKVFRGTNTVAALTTQKVTPELLKGEGDGRVNVLLLGIGGENHAGGDLTDTIMVLSIDPVNKTAAMLSVPRDLWVKMPVNYFGAYQKINAAYSSAKYKYLGKVDLASKDNQAIEAGFTALDQSIGNVLGININYHVLVNFQAFKQAVDSVGGVTVDVKEQLYDPTMAWENNYNPVLAAVGLQTMDGKRALNYARSRETSSDFARSERQRQLLVALKEKVLTMETLSSPTKITSLMNAFGENVHTDFSTQAASRLFSIGKDIKSTSISSLSLTAPFSLVTTDHVGNISVVRPKAGFDTYSDIQAYVRSQLKDGYLIKENANVYVVGATEALRSQTEQTLKNYGYVVSGSSVNATVSGGTSVIDKSAGKSPYTLHYLRDRYNSAETKTLPAGLVVPNDAQFVIIAGT